MLQLRATAATTRRENRRDISPQTGATFRHKPERRLLATVARSNSNLRYGNRYGNYNLMLQLRATAATTRREKRRGISPQTGATVARNCRPQHIESPASIEFRNSFSSINQRRMQMKICIIQILRVIVNILTNGLQLIIISDQAVIVLALPKTALHIHFTIYPECRLSFNP